MRLTLRKFGFLILAIYLLFTCYTSYILLSRKWNNFFHGASRYLKNSSKTHYDEKLRDYKFGPKPLALPRPNEDNGNNSVSNKNNRYNFESLVRQKLGAKTSSSPAPLNLPPHQQPHSSKEAIVEIWGKAAIGLFLWEHVLKGTLEERLGGIWSYGSKKVGRFKFRFRTGAGVVPEKVPRDIVNLVLVLNGRESAKQQFARMWLDFVADLIVNKNVENKQDGAENHNGDNPSSSTLKNVGVVLLGREDCDNDWLLPYMTRAGGVVKFAFVVYDTNLVDDVDIFQWPLGVATYRSFPKQCLATSDDYNGSSNNLKYERDSRLHLPVASTRAVRMYACNFLGTVYPNSTREELLRVLKSAPMSVQRACMIKVRAEWSPGETDETLAQYVRALLQSDLTLNPAGKNAECYRHFEAMSCGSVPVLLNDTHHHAASQQQQPQQQQQENNINSKQENINNDNLSNAAAYAASKCDRRRAPLRLFRQYGAPFIWLEKWEDVPNLIAREAKMSQEVKLLRRQEVMRWYRDFLKSMRTKFVQVLEKKFEL